MEREIFTYNTDIKKTAYLNWRMKNGNVYSNLFNMANGYFDSSLILMREILKDNIDKKADILIFAILYDVNQAIELYQKGIIYMVNKLMNIEYKIPISHEINNMFNEMYDVIKEKEKRTKGLNKLLNPLKRYLSELFYYIDVEKGKSDIDFSRYPIKTNGEEHFYIKSENIVVNIEKLYEEVMKIKDSLEGLYLKYENEIYNELQIQCEN